MNDRRRRIMRNMKITDYVSYWMISIINNDREPRFEVINGVRYEWPKPIKWHKSNKRWK